MFSTYQSYGARNDQPPHHFYENTYLDESACFVRQLGGDPVQQQGCELYYSAYNEQWVREPNFTANTSFDEFVSPIYQWSGDSGRPQSTSNLYPNAYNEEWRKDPEFNYYCPDGFDYHCEYQQSHQPYHPMPQAPDIHDHTLEHGCLEDLMKSFAYSTLQFQQATVENMKTLGEQISKLTTSVDDMASKINALILDEEEETSSEPLLMVLINEEEEETHLSTLSSMVDEQSVDEIKSLLGTFIWLAVHHYFSNAKIIFMMIWRQWLSMSSMRMCIFWRWKVVLLSMQVSFNKGGLPYK